MSPDESKTRFIRVLIQEVDYERRSLQYTHFNIYGHLVADYRKKVKKVWERKQASNDTNGEAEPD